MQDVKLAERAEDAGPQRFGSTDLVANGTVAAESAIVESAPRACIDAATSDYKVPVPHRPKQPSVHPPACRVV
jgi:hypothetical protein